LILAGSGLVAPFAWLAAKLFNARCIVYLHGLDIKAPSQIYRLLWHPFLRRFDRVIVNSRFTARLAAGAAIRSDKIHVLHPGVTIPGNSDARVRSDAFRAKYGLGDLPAMLYVGRLTPRKGLLEFVTQSLPSSVARCPNVRFLIVGGEPSHAILNATGQRAQLDATLATNGLAENVLFLGELPDAELRAAYFAADVFVFPIRHYPYDIEGFGMVALEAAAHGLPTVAFSAGGVPDAVRNGYSGDLVESGDYVAFTNAVLSRLAGVPRARPESRERVTTFARQFAWSIFGQRLRALTRLDDYASV
jgi:phosphatidylinositol alpha-1,6-mannosyltransferase